MSTTSLRQRAPMKGGAAADYIATLAKADTSEMAICLSMVDGNTYSAGDDKIEFTI